MEGEEEEGNRRGKGTK